LPDLTETWDKARRCGFNRNADLFLYQLKACNDCLRPVGPSLADLPL